MFVLTFEGNVHRFLQGENGVNLYGLNVVTVRKLSISKTWSISFNRKFWIKWQKTTGKRKKRKKKDGCKENSGFVLNVNLFLKAVQVVDGNTVFFLL